MAKRFNEKRKKQMEAAIERELNTGADRIDLQGTMANDLKAAAMGGTYVEGYFGITACNILLQPHLDVILTMTGPSFFRYRFCILQRAKRSCLTRKCPKKRRRQQQRQLERPRKRQRWVIDSVYIALLFGLNSMYRAGTGDSRRQSTPLNLRLRRHCCFTGDKERRHKER
jgi:hypothetical protein